MHVTKSLPQSPVGASTSGEAPKVRDNPAESQFELGSGRDLAIAGYERNKNVLIFNHTVVPSHLQGKGIASQLIGGALAIVRERGEKFVAVCSFVQDYVRKHPEVRDLLA